MNTLLTALYVKIDDWLGKPPRIGRPPKLTDAELLTPAVAQVLLGVRSEARWVRFVPQQLPGAFPYLPGQSGYNKRLRAALPLLKRTIRAVAADTDLWRDPVWVIDSTPVECARSRPTVKRSNLAGWANYGYCASHSRFFWRLRLHLVRTPAGLPITWALADPKIDEPQVLTAVLERHHLRQVPHTDRVRRGIRSCPDRPQTRLRHRGRRGDHHPPRLRPARRSAPPCRCTGVERR